MAEQEQDEEIWSMLDSVQNKDDALIKLEDVTKLQVSRSGRDLQMSSFTLDATYLLRSLDETEVILALIYQISCLTRSRQWLHS